MRSRITGLALTGILVVWAVWVGPATASATGETASPPVRIQGVHGTAAAPIVIEGLEITAVGTNGIAVVNSSYIVIRGNRIHYVTTDQLDDGVNGNAIYVQDSSHIEVADNVVTDNLRGIAIQATPGSPHLVDISAHGNRVERSRADAGILVRGAEGVDIHDNILDSNGDVTLFEKHRITGIEVWDSSHVRIHANTSTNSSSDGIGVATSREVLLSASTYVCADVEIYDNVSRGNGEQGIWMSVVHGGSIHGNSVTGNTNADPALGSSGIRLETSVDQFEVYDNVLARNEVAEIGISSSSGNDVHDNTITPGNIGVLIDNQHEPFQPAGPSRGNRIHNNVITNGPIGFRMHAGVGNAFVNNTVAGMTTDGIIIDPSGRGTTVVNNIIVDSRVNGMTNNSASSRIGANLYFGNGRTLVGVQPGSRDIFADPRFVDAASGNYRLRPTSPARGAGDPRFTYCRPAGPHQRPDMGAICRRRPSD